MKVLNSLTQRSLHLIHLIPFLCHEVAANTEIINFSSSRGPTVDLPLDVVGNWSTLRPTDNERRWSLEPAALHTPLHRVCERTDSSASVASSYPPFSCPHELWLLLDLDDETWASYSTFTLRLSWPASTPADFAIALYSPQDLLAQLDERGLLSSSSSSSGSIGRERTRTQTHAPTTRSRYAHIRAVHAGVPTPARSHPPALAPLSPVLVPVPRPDSSSSSIDADSSMHATGRGEDETVPFFVVLEPTYLGVLPATLLHAVWFLVPVVLTAAALVPWILAYLEPYARQAREEVALKAKTTCVDKDR